MMDEEGSGYYDMTYAILRLLPVSLFIVMLLMLICSIIFCYVDRSSIVGWILHVSVFSCIFSLSCIFREL